MFDSKVFLKTATAEPGIYQMINSQGEVLYVGKAKNLKKRLSSYFQKNGLSIKTKALVSRIHKIEVIVTRTENEALLLENTLIKKFKPRYNILFRDDKSYAYLALSHHEFPRLYFYRGVKQKNADFFGPYPSTFAIRETLNLLQKIFRLRQCDDVFFKNRTRPCLQYQIKRCTAPCVNFIDAKRYQEDVKHAVEFLKGKNQTIIEDCVKHMEVASEKLDYETAGFYRDQIVSLRQIQQQQDVMTDKADTDVIALATLHGSVCVQMLMIRGGRLLGSQSHFPAMHYSSDPEEVISAFLSQYYLRDDELREMPSQIILNYQPQDLAWLNQLMNKQAKRQIQITTRPKQERMRWLSMALQNAKQALATRLADKVHHYQRVESLKSILQLTEIPRQLVCFDVSHTMGEATVASCVVFDEQGPRKKDYRRFNITDITKGDDYAAMRQALSRYFTRLKKEEKTLPDVLIMDGGKGQLKQAEMVLEELQILGCVILGIAKGPGRKSGWESIFISGKSHPIEIDSESPGFHLLQHIRDEAHRFAITGHRKQRSKNRLTSPLENIPGIGAKRRQTLLQQFGGMQELKRASVNDIAKLTGFNQSLAERIVAELRKL